MLKRNNFFSAQYALMHHAIFPFDASTKSRTIKIFHGENVIMMQFKSRFELDYKKPRRSYTTYALQNDDHTFANESKIVTKYHF